MTAVRLAPGADAAGFRAAVRGLVSASVPPDAVHWTSDAAPTLFTGAEMPEAAPLSLPREAVALVELVVCHRDPERYGLLYGLIWRLQHGERHLLEVASDPLVHRLERMAKTVRRAIHKMHAFVRFRRAEATDGGERFVAWFEPDHFILEAVAGFFVERFRALDWRIVTPIGTLHWDRQALTFGPPGRREDVPAADLFEAGWRGYYESTFNPARLNLAVTRAEMPKKYWRNMPETAAIPELVRTSASRARAMIETEGVVSARRDPARAVAAMSEQVPQTLEALNRIIAAAPPMIVGGTRAVLGEGPAGAAIAFVGEQPGDQEDLQGRPFIGPAGQVLDQALADAGIDRTEVYLTNAVKHFKFVQRGKRRLHQRPDVGEVKHYQWWLRRELELVGPRLVVALGATAVLALTGRALAVTAHRGETTFEARRGFITVHPSYLLRLPDGAAKDEARTTFGVDMARIRDLAAA